MWCGSSVWQWLRHATCCRMPALLGVCSQQCKQVKCHWCQRPAHASCCDAKSHVLPAQHVGPTTLQVYVASDALASLEWRQFQVLTEVTLDCPGLEQLLFQDCDRLQGSMLHGLSDTTSEMVHGREVSSGTQPQGLDT